MILGARWMTAAMAAALIGLGATPAAALVPIPIGTPLGSATDLLTLSGTYSSLPNPATQPFASASFTLSLIVPAQVSVSAEGPVLSEFSVPVGGSYTDGGQTESFTTPLAVFGATNIDLPTFPDNFGLIVNNLIQPSDSFVVSFQASGPLFNPTIFNGQPETIATGSFSVTDASASYNADPPFTGTLTITPLSAIPEPSSWALALMGFAGLGAAVRTRRRRDAHLA